MILSCCMKIFTILFCYRTVSIKAVTDILLRGHKHLDWVQGGERQGDHFLCGNASDVLVKVMLVYRALVKGNKQEVFTSNPVLI
jgi:hypothetical protein